MEDLLFVSKKRKTGDEKHRTFDLMISEQTAYVRESYRANYARRHALLILLKDFFTSKWLVIEILKYLDEHCASCNRLLSIYVMEEDMDAVEIQQSSFYAPMTICPSCGKVYCYQFRCQRDDDEYQSPCVACIWEIILERFSSVSGWEFNP